MISNLSLIAVSAGRGVRIARRGESDWTIATVLSSQDVRCIAVDPGNAQFETHIKLSLLHAGTKLTGFIQTVYFIEAV